jgi:hypothetical protein
LNDDICEHIAEQTNLYAEQKRHEKTLLNKMTRSQDKYYILTYKDEMKLLLRILLLQGIVQKSKMSDHFSQNRLLAMPTFYGSMSEKRFFMLLKLLNSEDNEAYHGQVPPMIYKIKTIQPPDKNFLKGMFQKTSFQ